MSPPSDMELVLHIQRSAVDRFHSRRQVEWQFSFTLWLLLGALALATREMDREELGRALILVLAVGAVLFHWAFQAKYVYKQMSRDYGLGIEIEKHIRSMLEGQIISALPDLSPDKVRPEGYSWFWSHGWQVLITAVVAAVAVLSVV